MRIKIFNKNNDAWFDVCEGAVITLCKNETLNRVDLVIAQQPNKLDIEPLDQCVVEDDRLGIIYFDIAEKNERIICLNPRFYEYDLKLVSQVKELESWPCPDLNITQLVSELHKNYEMDQSEFPLVHRNTMHLNTTVDVEHPWAIHTETNTATYTATIDISAVPGDVHPEFIPGTFIVTVNPLYEDLVVSASAQEVSGSTTQFTWSVTIHGEPQAINNIISVSYETDENVVNNFSIDFPKPELIQYPDIFNKVVGTVVFSDGITWERTADRVSYDEETEKLTGEFFYGTPTPNKTIVSFTISVYYSGKRNIWYYLNRYNNEYGPKIRTPDGIVNKYIYSNDVIERFRKIVCPELQFSKPTFRELLNKLMMVNDCIVTMNNNVIEFMDLTEKGKDISENTTINYVTYSLSIEDYCSEIQMNAVNAMQNKMERIDNVARTSEVIPWNAYNSYIMTKDNRTLKTRYPIIRLISLEMLEYVTNSTGFPTASGPLKAIIKYDLSKPLETTYYYDGWQVAEIAAPLVTDYREFVKKRIYPVYLITSIDEAITSLGGTQNGSAYFNYGQREFYNFNEQFGFKNVFLQNLNITVSEIISKYAGFITGIKSDTNRLPHQQDVIKQLREKGLDPDNYIISWSRYERFDTSSGTQTYISYPQPLYYQNFFRVVYETSADCLFRASKKDYPLHDRIIIDNQSDNYVEVHNLGLLEYMKANRLGNEMATINARYYDGDELIELSDVFDNSLIFELQYKLYEHHIDINGFATKNYILRDYFTSIKSKLRLWSVASSNEGIEKNVIHKYYCILDTHKHEDNNVTNIAYYLMSPLYSYTSNPLKYSVVKTEWTGTEYGSSQSYPENSTTNISLELIKRLVGNSIILSSGFEDNYSAGRYVDISSDNFNSSGNISSGLYGNLAGIPQKDVQYTNDEGEFDRIYISYCDEMSVINDLSDTTLNFEEGQLTKVLQFENYFLSSSEAVQKWIDLQVASLRRPLVEEAGVNKVMSFVYDTLKDDREIPYMTTQFEFWGGENISINEVEFAKRQKMISTIDNDTSGWKVYGDSLDNFIDDYYILGSSDIPGSNCSYILFCLPNYGDGQSDSTAKSNLLETLSEYKTLIIADENDNIICSFKIEDAELEARGSGPVYKAGIMLYMSVLTIRHLETYDSQSNQNFLYKI